MSNIVRVEKRIMTDCVEENHNKFWTGELYSDGTVITRWGRVGDTGQFKQFPGAGVSFLEKKLREKEGKGYRVIESVGAVGATTKSTVTPKSVNDSNLRDVALKQIKSNNPLVTKLIDFFVKENAHQIMESTGGKITYNDTTGLFTTATGDVVGQRTIDEANVLLEEIADMIVAGNYGIELGRKTNEYLMKITCDFGRKKLDVREFWSDLSKVQSQKQILDSLQASLVSATTTSISQRAKTISAPEEKVFDCQLHLIEDGKEIDRIRKFYNQTRQRIHASSNLDVKTVYSVDINTVRNSFEKDGAKMNNIFELWHGTKCSACLSIIRSGLRMPNPSSSNVTGRMFSGRPGKEGLYFSDQSTKSLNYATNYWSGGRSSNRTFMFLAQVAMGNYFTPNGPRNDLPRPGYDSTFAKANISGVMNNEFIVYRGSQVNLTRLIEFTPNGK